MMEETAPRKPKGGRPKGDPNAIRIYRVNARLSASEHATLTAKADQIGMPMVARSRLVSPPSIAPRPSDQPRGIRKLSATIGKP
jgi:hypothetical protein